MTDRNQLLHNIDQAYDARLRDDKDALAACFAPDATFRLVGRADLLCPDIPVEQGCAAAATSALIDMFQFHDLERLDAVVEGNSAAVHWRLSASRRGGEPVSTEVYDLWTFDDDGRATSLVQFADTALIAHLLKQGEPVPA